MTRAGFRTKVINFSLFLSTSDLVPRGLMHRPTDEAINGEKDPESQLKQLADFLFEVGMLRKTPRSGFQFLGSGGESVAEHSYRTAIIGYLLARKCGVSWERVMLMCLVHDLHEARVGDFNYVNRLYNRADEWRAFRDAVKQTGPEEHLLEAAEELEATQTEEAKLARDADQLDLILTLKEEQDLGNPYAPKWMHHAVKRLRTEYGQKLARAIQATDHTDWWFAGVDSGWWSRDNGCGR